jgi:hypothetical protein
MNARNLGWINNMREKAWEIRFFIFWFGKGDLKGKSGVWGS